MWAWRIGTGLTTAAALLIAPLAQAQVPPDGMTPEEAQAVAASDLDFPPIPSTAAGIDAQIAEADAMLATCDPASEADANGDLCPTAASWLVYIGSRTNRPAVQARGLAALVAMATVAIGPDSEIADSLRIQYIRMLILLRQVEPATQQIEILRRSLSQPDKPLSVVRAELGLADAELAMVAGRPDEARRILIALLAEIDGGRIAFADGASLARATMLVLSNLALMQLMAGEPAGVPEIAARAIAVHEQYPQGLDGVALVYACWSIALLYTEDRAGAMERAELAMAVSEKRGVRDLAYAMALQARAMAHANLGDVRAAEEELRRSIAILQEWNTGYPWHKLVNVLAQTLLVQGRLTEAERLVKLALETNEDGDLYYTLGMLRQIAQDAPASIAALTKARALLPRDGTPGQRTTLMAVESALSTAYLLGGREAEADPLLAGLAAQLEDTAIPLKVRMQAAVAVATRGLSLGDYASAATIFEWAERYYAATSQPESMDLLWMRASSAWATALNGDIVNGYRKLAASAKGASAGLAAKDFDEGSREKLRMLSPIFRWQVMIAFKLSAMQDEIDAMVVEDAADAEESAAAAAAEAADAIADAP